ncbi:MAG: hypothetical protein ACK4MU_09155, partial [Thermomonas sp.]
PASAGLEQCLRALEAQLEAVVAAVRNPLSERARGTLGALIVLDVHGRDAVQQLLRAPTRAPDAIDWVAQLRYYWRGGDLVATTLQCTQPYGYEYLGDVTRLVVTPLTLRCLRTLMCALAAHHGGAPEGPAGTGKTALMREWLRGLEEEMQSCTINMNYYMDARMLQAQLEQVIDKRSGAVFGPPANKRLVYFVDDLNLPYKEKYGTQNSLAL